MKDIEAADRLVGMTHIEKVTRCANHLALCGTTEELAHAATQFAVELAALSEAYYERGKRDATIEPEDWRDRVKLEAYDLKDKVKKLADFLDRDEVQPELDPVDYALLAEQLLHMTSYAQVLAKRIARFSNASEVVQ